MGQPSANAQVLFWVWAAAIGCPSHVARAMVTEGRVPQESNFAMFVTKFCYDYTPGDGGSAGQVIIDMQSLAPAPRSSREPASGKLYFMIFSDQQSHWKKIRGSWETSTCNEKLKVASDVVDLALEPRRLNNSYSVHILQHVRPRFWYFALVACNLQLTDPIRYRIHMVNDAWGWQEEFSLDHMGLPFLYAAFTVFFGMAASVTAYAARLPRGGMGPPLKDHPYMHLILLAYWSSVASCALFLAHYSIFIQNGQGSRRIRFLGVFASIVATCTIFLIAMLASVGWGITTFALPNRRTFLATISLVGGISALSELHAELAVDQSTKLYSYQSGPGVFVLIIRIFMFCWFAYQTKLSHDEQQNERLRNFYKFLALGVTLWTLNVPFAVVLAFNLSPWVRYKIVATVEIAARFAGSMLLTHLFCGPVEIAARFAGSMLLTHLFCGPVSPIMFENTFPFVHAPSAEPEFDPLDDGHG